MTFWIALGVVIAVAAAVVFAGVGALVLLGGWDATRGELMPGLARDRVGPAWRLGELVLMWGPLLVLAGFALATGARLVALALAALTAVR
jgi:hypothetical protein